MSQPGYSRVRHAKTVLPGVDLRLIEGIGEVAGTVITLWTADLSAHLGGRSVGPRRDLPARRAEIPGYDQAKSEMRTLRRGLPFLARALTRSVREAVESALRPVARPAGR